MPRPHPATLLLLWILLVSWAVGQAPDRLTWLVPAGCLVAGGVAGLQFRRLLWRSRWLFLTIAACLAWLTPGRPLSWTGLSMEGAEAALEQVGRLLLVMAAVAVLLAILAPPRLIEAIRLLAAPLSILGIDRDRVALRLALTLRYLEEGGAGRRIRSLADIDAVLERTRCLEGSDAITFGGQRFAPLDMALVVLAALVAAGLAVW